MFDLVLKRCNDALLAFQKTGARQVPARDRMMRDELAVTGQFFNKGFKATPHDPRLKPLHAICLHIFRHITQILLERRQPSCVEFRQSDEKSQLNFIELARNLMHRGHAVLP